LTLQSSSSGCAASPDAVASFETGSANPDWGVLELTPGWGRFDEMARGLLEMGTSTSAKHIVSALRSFFRFARYRDYVRTDSSWAISTGAKAV
jgi:hypothetical protein